MLSPDDMDAVDFYLEFDQAFFVAGDGRLKGADREAAIAANAEKYRALLTENRKGLKQVLAGKKTVGDAMLGIVYQDLCRLMQVEQKDGGLLRKWVGDYAPLKVSLEDLCTAAGVEFTRLSRNQQWYLRGRVGAHLVRLMKPREYDIEGSFSEKQQALLAKAQNTVCETFAREYIRWVSKYHPRTSYCDLKGQYGIGSEGDGPGLFWTVAPYVHAELKRSGMTPDESMRKINQWWLRAAKSHAARGESLGFGMGDLEPTVPSYRLDSYLGYDERMPTHLGARLQAVGLVMQGF